MRILIAHEAVVGGGGVESYLAALIPALQQRGHAVAFLHHHTRREQGPVRLEFHGVPSFSLSDDGFDPVVARVAEWGPEVCFSHNMRHLEVDEALASRWPVAKMLHGYFGTCISGQKAHGFPSFTPCAREFGAACLGLYLPRRCGQLRPLTMFRKFAWNSRQRGVFDRYASVVVASRHMQEEYVRHGIPAQRVVVAPLFPTAVAPAWPRVAPAEPTVLFAGRMTPPKGPGMLIPAVAVAAGLLERPVKVVMAGEGPERESLVHSARARGIEASFPGWVTGAARDAVLRHASVIVVPSLWPEPFGLVGLEAAAHGVPAVAFDVGGISEWLRDGVNGRLVRPAGDATALGRAIAEVLGAPSLLRTLERGAKQIASEMTLERHLRIVESALEACAV